MPLPDARYRAYDADRDRSAVAALWAAALPTWPIAERALPLVSHAVIADAGGAPVGFLAFDPAGSVQVLLVHPDHQRRGLGTALLMSALESMPAVAVRAGSGGARHIWPGVPLDLPAAVAFFAHNGFVADHDCVDLTRDLHGYVRPADAYDRPGEHGITFSSATAGDRPAVLAFEATEFPYWVDRFDHAGSGAGEDILLARDPHGEIVGSLLYSARDAGTYSALLGPDPGMIACVGVAKDRNGQGIGTALVVRASEILRDAGTRVCVIDWVERVAFYERAGYSPWRRYRMSHRPAP